MSPLIIILFILGYFAFLIGISYFTTSKNNSNEAFFTGNRQSPWYIVAFGMIGTSLSGVTFISVPGWVATSQFSYMQMVLGYLVGYLVIGLVLMPLYYKMNLVSIYSYLESRFGFRAYKTGAWFFLISRVLGASFRLYLVAMVFQLAIFKPLNWDIPFFVTVLLTILLIWLYTFRGGIKTIVYTDTLQTLFMLTAVGVTLYVVGNELNLAGEYGLIETIANHEYSQIFFFDDWKSGKFFWKQFLAGTFIAIAMTGLDQDMMQKNLTCRNLRDAQKNMFWFSTSLVLVNLLFLTLGAVLYIFISQQGIPLPEKADYLYPMLAVGGYLGPVVGMLFILGLIAAAYSSADSALTALTTSFCVDILGIERKNFLNPAKTRKLVHVGMSIVLLIVITGFQMINNESVIKSLFIAAGYTYGPLLGMFAFGILSKKEANDRWIPLICIISPIFCYFLKDFSLKLFDYTFGFELLILNALLTILGLLFVSTAGKPTMAK
ncbi:MAG: sodium:solute symporter [Salibacteraceae bacterium]|nr:sodium:solute symporter [Salibacteraceae bacterium]|tara:strand:+ start:30828 stop:32300 length:1473 start_codon:yes stop_codon:yes gene_type:complete